MALAEGSVVAGKYRIVREIGAGGMGTVYVAHNQNLGRDEALKVMYERFLTNEEAGRRFVQEARAVAKLSHPGVVNVFDSGRDDCGYWLAMELLDGESLGARLARGPLGDEELKTYVPQLLDTLRCVHEAGVIHRDLKPDNIFLERLPTGQWRTRMLDFGVAKYADASFDMFATQADASVGTPHYMAPEQATHASNVDARADLYSFGVILYQCVCGTLPYDAASFGDLIVKMHNQRPKPQRVKASLKPYLDAALACLQVEPRARPENALAVAKLLRIHLPSLPPTDTSGPRRGQLMGVAIGASAAVLGVVLLTRFLPERSSAHVASPAELAPRPRELVDAALTMDAAVALEAGAPDAGTESSEAGAAEIVDGGAAAAKAPPRWLRWYDAGVLPLAPVQTGPLTPEQLSQVVNGRRGELQRCYERALRATGGHSTQPVKITVNVVVSPRGRASHVSTQGEGFGELTDCIDRTVSRFQFPASSEGATFAFPLLFAPGG
jgi:eukaryotic-like serine/threonine-protein kinase